MLFFVYICEFFMISHPQDIAYKEERPARQVAPFFHKLWQ